MSKVTFVNIDFDSLIAEAESKKNTIPALQQWDFDNPNDVLRFVLEFYVENLEKLGAWANALSQEWTIGTALSRESVIEHALQLGYVPTYRVSAEADVNLTHNDPASNTSIPAGALVLSAPGSDGKKVYFENKNNITLLSGQTTLSGVEVIEGRTRDKTFTSSGTSFQSIILNVPITEGSIKVFIDDVLWQETDTFVTLASGAERYRLRRLNQSTTQVLFGDNTNGKVPPEGSEIRIEYREGGGERGNVKAETITTIETNPQASLITAVTNPTSAGGGSDPESTEKIRYSAVRLPRLNNRIVSISDIEFYGDAYDGITRTKAYPNFNSPLVYIIPDGGGSPAAGLITDVQSDMNNIVVLGNKVTVSEPNYVTVTLEIDVVYNPSYLKSSVENSVDSALEDLLNPLLKSENGNWKREFGEPLRVSEIVNTVFNVPGVLAVEIQSPEPTASSDVLVSCNDDQIITNVGSTVTLEMIESKNYEYVSGKSVKTLFRNPKYDT